MSTLREIIEQCTAGPWQTLDGSLVKAYAPTIAERRKAKRICGVGETEDAEWNPEMHANGQLIARLNPQTALLVLNALESCDHLLDSPNRTSQELATWGRVLEALAALNGTPPTA